MKIGVVVDNDLNNDNRVIREIKILKDHNHEVFVLCFGFGRQYVDPVKGINITRISLPRKLKDTLFFFSNSIPLYELLWILRLKRFIADYQIDVLHVHDLYMSGPAHRGIKKSGRRIPFVLDLHENYPYAVTTYNWTKGLLRSTISRPLIWQKREKKLLKYARKIVVLSEEFRDVLTDRYKCLVPEDFCIFPNVPDLKQMNRNKVKTPVFPFTGKIPVLFYFGTVAERRGVFDALEVFGDLLGDGINLHLLIAGPVDKKDRTRFFGLINSSNLKANVTYIPWINYSELPGYLEISDICLAPFLKNPQHESGVANKVYDYMYGSRPVIASDCRPQRNLIDKYNCGIVYGERAEFRNAVIRLISDKNLREQMGRNGYNAVVTDLNTGRLKHNLTEMYDHLEAEKENQLKQIMQRTEDQA